MDLSSSSLYRSDWNPPGIRKDWDRCSMGTASTKRLLGSWDAAAKGEMVEAVAWFDLEGGLKVLVADYDNGRRIVLRNSGRSTKIAFQRHDRTALPTKDGEAS